MTDINTIPDARMTASDFLDTSSFPYYGRLRGTRGDGGWCPERTFGEKKYIQVDMGEVRSLCGVATQGLQRYPEWTTTTNYNYLQTVQLGTYTRKRILKRYGEN